MNSNRVAHSGCLPVRKRHPATVLGGLTVVALLLAGCGRSGPVVEYVEGVVMLDGTPVEGCVVGFSPLDAGGVSAYGRTDSSGAYRVTCARGGAPAGGAAAGRYAVTLTKQKTREREGWPAQASRPDDVVDLLPKAYGNAETSGITVTVQKGRNVGPEFRFDLKSDFKPDGNKP